MNSKPGANVIKLFKSVITKDRNKLKCLSLTSFFSLAYCLWVRPRAYPEEEHLRGTSPG